MDVDALKDLVRRANFLPYLSYGSPHDLSILEKISGYYHRGSSGARPEPGKDAIVSFFTTVMLTLFGIIV